MKYCLVVDTEKRTSGDINNFLIALKPPIQSISSFKVADVMIANTFYNINSSNNVLTTEDGSATLTAGYYNITELVAELNTQLQALDATYLVSHSSITNKLTIARTGAFTVTHTALLEMLGFSSSLSGSASYTSSKQVNLLKYRDVYIECSELSTGCISHLGKRNIIKKIPLKSNLGEFVFSNMEETKLELSHTVNEIHSLNFRLIDMDGNLVSTDIDFSFSIYFE